MPLVEIWCYIQRYDRCRILCVMPTRKQLKRIGVDILGYLLIIAAGLTGWIPGPGGIPLLILGLSLLATNHEWARRWLEVAQKQGVNISNKLFGQSPKMRWAVDLASVTLIAIAVVILQYFARSPAKVAAISLILASSFLLLGNRERFASLKHRLQKKS
jgi:hypothetical protein